MKTMFGLAVGLFISAVVGLAAEEVFEVAFALGPKHFNKGDAIIIEHVVATSQNFAVGDRVMVSGRYTLSSEERAALCLYLTTSSDVGPEPVLSTQRTEVNEGSSTFVLLGTVKHPGNLHLSFYSGGGKRLGTVYFGTEQQMKEINHWKLRD